jgi:signal transduction histidine kinase
MIAELQRANAALRQQLVDALAERDAALAREAGLVEVLDIINRSPGNLTPVFDAILDKAHDLCGANIGSLMAFDGTHFRATATHGLPAQRAALVSQPFRPTALSQRLVDGERFHHVLDVKAIAMHPDDELTRDLVDRTNIRTSLMVALRKDGALLGYISAFRHEVRPFSDREISLLESFAAQAVIAMENARLLGELRERTAELTRSVGELQALQEVLHAVNSSLDLDTVLATVINRAVRLSDADEGMIYGFDETEGVFVPKSAVGMTEDRIAGLRQARIKLGETYLGRSALERKPVYVDDVQQYPDLGDAAALLEGIHAVLAVPLLKEDKVLGGLVIRRRTKGGFAPTTVMLMSAFASQSALAMQNAALFQQLAEKSQQLQLASEHKSQFLANMSHELRTPLNAILGYTELLVDGIYGDLPGKSRGVLDRVQENGRNLLALINDVLDLAKIEAGQFTLSLEAYQIGPLARNVVDAMQPLARGKGLSLVATVADDLPTGYGDARRLRQVLVNLVGNAIKFTDAGEVEISVATANGRLDVAVRDTGPGIAPEDQEMIFEEFQQVDNSSTRRKGGTGLGLAISRQIVMMHGGRLSVASTPGRGSTFHVDIPVRFKPDTQGVL